MASGRTSDVNTIQDEDTLRRMWQETEDFGRKKEIRAHMYKLREARLRDFYTTGEVGKDIQRAHTSPGLRENIVKGSGMPTHADSLADHSFLSLKSKEIRDSESPIRDMSYKITTDKRGDQGWTVQTSNERSNDGKTHTTTRLATTSGSQPIDGGVSNYAAKNEQKSSVFQDGDDKNFTKAVSADSKNVIHQEASGGDENSSFKTTASKTSTSSRVVTEHKSTSGEDHVPVSDVDTVVHKTYTTNVPQELRKHPNYVDGNTKVFTETKTLPDGSVVTTTRYETREGKAATNTYSTSSKQVSSNEQRSSSVRNVTDSRHAVDDVDNSRIIRYTTPQDINNEAQNYTTTSTSKTVKYVQNQNTDNVDHYNQRNVTERTQDTQQRVDNRDVKNIQNVTRTTREEVINYPEEVREIHVTNRRTQDNDSFKGDVNKQTRIIREEVVIPTHEVHISSRRTQDVDNHQDVNKKTENIQRTVREEFIVEPTQEIITKRNVEDIRRVNNQGVRNIQITTEAPETHTTVTKTTTVYKNGRVDDKKVVTDDFINVEREHVRDTQTQIKESPIYPEPQTPREYKKEVEIIYQETPREEPRYKEPSTKDKPERYEEPTVRNVPVESIPKHYHGTPKPNEPQVYESPERRQPIKPAKSEMDQKTKPTDGQYDTTYRTDYVTKRISVDVSPTHDAFARSLRAITPERDIKSPRGSTRSLRTSTSSLRSSTSPEKYPSNRQVTPDRFRGTSPKKSPTKPEKFTDRSSPDRKPYNSRGAPAGKPSRPDDYEPRSSPERKPSKPNESTRPYGTRPAAGKPSMKPDGFNPTKSTARLSPDKYPTRKPSYEPSTSPDRKPSNIKPTSGKPSRPDDHEPRYSPDRYTTRITHIDGKTNEPRRSTHVKVTTDTTTRTSRKQTEYDFEPEDVETTYDTTNKRVNTRVTNTSRKSPDFKPYRPNENEPEEYEPKQETPDDKQPRKHGFSTDTITRISKVKDDTKTVHTNQVNTNSLTRRSKVTQEVETRSRSISPTSTASDIEYVRGTTEVVTDLDVDDTTTVRKVTDAYDIDARYNIEETTTTEKRPSSLDVVTVTTTKKSKKITDRSPTSPMTSPKKQVPSPIRDAPSFKDTPRKSSLKSPSKEPVDDKPKPLKRTDTYEERCRQILGIPDKKTVEKNITDILITDRRTTRTQKPESSLSSPTKEHPRKPSIEDEPKRKSMSPSKDTAKIQEFPSQIRKPAAEKSPERRKPKETTNVFMDRERYDTDITITKYKTTEGVKSPEKAPNRKSPTKEQDVPDKAKLFICEFPSQIRKSPEKELLESYPERQIPEKTKPSVSELPSQIRKIPEKETLEPYTERQKPNKSKPSIGEFPSQVKRSPEKEPLEPYPEKQKPEKTKPLIGEFPSQIKRSPEKEPLEPYPEKQKPDKTKPSICEFPSQIKRSPEKEPLEPYPEKQKPDRTKPSIGEFPSQIKRSPEKEVLEPYPEKQKPEKTKPSVCEFPSQIKRSPEKEPLEQYPEKQKPNKTKPSIGEFPSQIKRTHEKEPLEPYPEKKSPVKYVTSINEFPSQSRKSPERVHFVPDSDEDEPSETRGKPLQPAPRREPVDEFPGVKKTVYVENTVPVNEPEFTKKFITTLCQEDETDRITQVTKVNRTSSELEESYRPNKTIKKDTPDRSPDRRTPKTFIDKERTDTDITIKQVKKGTTQYKAPKTKPEPIDHTGILKRKVVTKKTTENETEYTDQYGRIKPSNRTPTKLEVTKTTLHDVENISDTEVDDSIHIRTHRIDDVYTNRKSKIVYNGDGPKGKPAQPKTKPQTPTEPSRIIIKKTTLGKPADKPKKPAMITRRPSDKDIPRRVPGTSPEKKMRPDSKIKPKSPERITKLVENDKNVYNTRKVVTETIDTTKVSKLPVKPTKPMPDSTPKRHVVSTVINVSPKTAKPTRPTSKTTVTHTTVKTTRLSQPKWQPTPKSTQKPKPKVQNGFKLHYDESDSDSSEDLVEVEEFDIRDTRVDSRRTEKITRTTSDQLIKPKYRAPVRGFSKPELITESKPIEKKCVTTKSIIINNNVADEREIIVDLQRSKSSREPTPDRIFPHPATSDEEYGVPRYPDKISEPDDGSLRRRPKKLSDIPIMESEDDITRISKITEVDKVTETDESLLSVTEKVSKFSNVTPKGKKPLSTGPAPKILRPKFEVDDDLETDECLLSVSDKVSKFITTAEQLTTQPDRPKSPRCQYVKETDLDDDECHLTVSEKVTHFSTTNQLKPEKQAPKVTKVSRPEFTDVDETLISDDCLLSVSDKVTKFITTAEKISTTDKKSINLDKLVEVPRRSPSPTRRSTSPKKDTECVTIESEEQTYTRRSTSPEKSPRKPQPSRISPEKTSRSSESPTPKASTPTTPKQDQYQPRKSQPQEPDNTPKTSRRASQDEKTVLSTTSRLRSTESIKRARALFENITKEPESPKQRDIISRPSVFEGRRTKPDTTPKKESGKPKNIHTKLEYSSDEEEITKKTHYNATDMVFHKFKPSEITSEDEHPTYRPSSRETSQDKDMPGYMRPLDRSIRPNSPHLENLSKLTESTTRIDEHEPEPKTSKFGVTLRRTDSGRAITTSITTERRRSSATEKVKSDIEVEDIFDLEILEELLERTIDYEIRRKIRAQIRIVKRLISEQKIEKKTVKQQPKTFRPKSPEKTKARMEDSTEYQTKYSRKTSSPSRITDNKLYKHTDIMDRKDTSKKTTEYQTSYTYNERRTSSEIRSQKTERRSSSPETKYVRGKSPDKRSPERKTTKTFPAELKRVPQVSKSVPEDKPEWAVQRNLRKVTDKSAPVRKSTTSTTTTSRKETIRSSSPTKEKTDVITSSYGVGPMDENGTPLFGLKALRAQNKTEKSKVQGTIIKSQYYSENGKEPVGEISVTKYSTDPHDLGEEELVKTKGMASVTTTQKFGYKGTPSLKTMTDKKKQICDADNEKRSTKTVTKVSRRGSVKEISQKFIENAVETLKSEKQTSYPKAGLILRTSSFKDTKDSISGSSREGSPERQEIHRTLTVKTSRTGGETFLSNKSKVTGMQDVITRMRNTEEYEEGETQDDVEAKNLLNKFIGSQVILHGMQSHTSQPTTTSSSSSTVRRTSSKVVSTVTEGGKPKTITRTFQHPVTEEELETVWDEQTLKLLLEQSTDYEERRLIRARLRQVMAEQEACAELVEQMTQEKENGSVHGESLLLPLLQGLLDAPETEQTPDSGTESGEDLRGGLIVEVQSALDKLSTSLLSDSTDDMSSERRDSLLQLVTRLQAGLASQQPANAVMSTERRGSQGRFSKRRQRQNRHTVGVTSEELEDARRLMEEIALRDHKLDFKPLKKQNSEGTVTGRSTFNPAPKSPVKNAVPKPFSSSNTSTSLSGTSSTVDTPTDASESQEPLFSTPEVKMRDKKPGYNPYRKSLSLDPDLASIRPLSESVTALDYSQVADIKNAHHAAVQAAASKQLEISESETDDDPSTVKAPVIIEDVQTPVILQNNPVYSDAQKRVNEASKFSRFDGDKKLRMKRANTIDIPKPLHFYDDDGDEGEEIDIDRNTRRNTYYALRGPIRVGTPNNANSAVPTFEPKTDSDRKFMAFISKHNESTTMNKGSLWAKDAEPEQQGTNWTRKFGNIKTAFEKASEPKPTAVSSARNFWKSADDAVSAGRVTTFGPKISRQSARNLQQMFEEKQKQSKIAPWADDSSNVVTGSLKVDTKGFEANKNYKVVSQGPHNKFSHAPMSAFRPISKSISPAQNQQIPLHNNETHKVHQSNVNNLKLPLKSNTTTSANDGNSEAPLYLYSPKLLGSPSDSTGSSPIPHPAPWVPKTQSESRVLNIAASRFESQPVEQTAKPRKLSKDRVFIPPVLQQQQIAPAQKITAPYLVKTATNTVRKLSDQYDSLGNKIPPAASNIKYVPPYTNPITKQSFAPKNYSNSHNANKMIQNSKHSAFAAYNPPQTQVLQSNSHAYYPTPNITHPTAPNPQAGYVSTNIQGSFPQNNTQGNFPQTNHQGSFPITNTQGYYPQPNTTHVSFPLMGTNESYPYATTNEESYPQNINSGSNQINHQPNSDIIYPAELNYPQPSVTYEIYPDAPVPYPNCPPPESNSYQVQQYSPQPAEEYTSSYQYQPQQQQQQPNAGVYNYVQQAPEQNGFHTRQSVPIQTPQPVYNYNQSYIPGNTTYYSQPQPQIPLPYNQQQQQIQPVQQYNSHGNYPTKEAERPYCVYNNVYTSKPLMQQQETPKVCQKQNHDTHEAKQLYEDHSKQYKDYVMQNKDASKQYKEPSNQSKQYPSGHKPHKDSHDSAKRPHLKKQVSQESTKEYTAVSSRVMTGPVSQQAVTVTQNKPKSRSDHDMDAAFNLKNTLQNLNRSESLKSPVAPAKKPQSKPKTYAAPNLCVNDEPMNLHSLEINEKGESVVTSKFHIPVKTISKEAPAPQVLSKSESWHQIVQERQQTTNKPSPRASPNSRTVVRSKSSHALAVPKQFEAGMSRDEMKTKKRSLEGYFNAEKPASAVKVETRTKRSINRVRTSEKVSTEKVETTKTTYTEGPVSTTQVTTRMTTSQQTSKKPMSPFAKFRQLDKQNSLNSPPSTPKTPTGAGALFKFTDPNLNRSANTIKERLLQWCQMKTKEYENIQLDNFSTSWADGLAFCALVHHFLPDAFDYHSLSPKNRRHNFTLAFQVADDKAGIAPLLDVDDMVETRKPDWKCVFTYVQTIYRRFKDED